MPYEYDNESYISPESMGDEGLRKLISVLNGIGEPDGFYLYDEPIADIDISSDNSQDALG